MNHSQVRSASPSFAALVLGLAQWPLENAAVAQTDASPVMSPAAELHAGAPQPTAGEPAAAAPAAEQAPAPFQGILPLEDYKGDFWSRSRLLGDLGGARTSLAEKGLTFGVEWTQVVQSVVDGGRNTATEYGGGLDYLINCDFDRMHLIPGGLLRMRAESRYGVSVNGDAGPLTPVNTDALVPFTSEVDDGIAITITNLNYTQFLSPKFGIMLGKFDTFDGDANEFASGRGVSQFMNSSMVASGVFAAGLPYSTLGMAALWLPTPRIQVQVALANSSDSSTSSGFEDIGEGWIASTEAHFQYTIGTLPGGVTAGGFYIGDADFRKIGARFAFEPGEGLSPPRDDSMWSVYGNVWQYVYVKGASDTPIDLLNGKPDREGLGLFARAAVADDDTNPIGWSAGGGVGGRGMIPGRENDWFGVGYFYNHIVVGRFTGFAGLNDEAQGFEAFYNVGITPAAHLTLDIQVVDGALPDADDAVVLGARLGMTF